MEEKSTSDNNSQDSSSIHPPKKIKVENEDVNISFESSQSPILLGSIQTSSESNHKISSPSSSNSSKKAINVSLRSLLETLELCSKRISSLEADISGLRTDISGVRADISQLRVAIKNLMDEKALLNTGEGESYTTLREQYPDDHKFRIKFGEAFKEIKDEIKGKEDEIKRKEDEIKRKEDEIKVLMAEIKDKEQSLKDRRNLSRLAAGSFKLNNVELNLVNRAMVIDPVDFNNVRKSLDEFMTYAALDWNPDIWYAPYTSLIGPSMIGKTYLLRQLSQSKKAFVSYICLRSQGSTGVPPRSIHIADYLKHPSPMFI